MTRFTNLARPKRTYVEAGFNDSEPQAVTSQNTNTSTEAGDDDPQRQKHARSKKTKFADFHTRNGAAEDEEIGGKGEGMSQRPAKKAKFDDKFQRGPKHMNARKVASEQRRLKRVDDRHSSTICFACREKGHTARDCSNTLATDTLEGEQGVKSGRDVVGICYRCGSRRHTLSRCKELVDPANPLPFASCFVCSGSGHLASNCPKNQSKGIYPNGGCCKLCKETTHLAKDCPLRKQEVVATRLFVGTGQEGGADEDDFHVFKRKTADVDKTKTEKAKRKIDSGTMKALGEPGRSQKKAVFF